MTRTLAAVALAAVVAGAACQSPTSPRRSLDLPAAMRLEASASGTVEGLSIECRIDFLLSLGPVGDEVRGTMGGEIQRAVLQPDGSGVAFVGDAFYPDLRISMSSPGRARLLAYKDGAPWEPTGESRFWDHLLAFEGTYDRSRRTVSGTWLCRPLDTREDVVGDIPGTWTLRPADAP